MAALPCQSMSGDLLLTIVKKRGHFSRVLLFPPVADLQYPGAAIGVESPDGETDGYCSREN